METTSIESYRANGKLLLSGEYFVLAGAKSLAIPTKFGQTMQVVRTNEHFLYWEAKVCNEHWFKAIFDEELNIISTDHSSLSEQLKKILLACINLRDDIKTIISGSAITTHLEFDTEWGFGSSSTLISLLAQWLGVHPYLLLEDTFGGSGYDIACATARKSITYQLKDKVPCKSPIEFSPSFADRLFFIYTGHKQNSRNEINRIDSNAFSTEDIVKINEITDQLITCESLENFQKYMVQHETIVSKAVGLQTVKSERFNDFSGEIKSLGAWGGDFILALSDKEESYVSEYFKNKGLTTMFSFNELIYVDSHDE